MTLEEAMYGMMLNPDASGKEEEEVTYGFKPKAALGGKYKGKIKGASRYERTPFQSLGNAVQKMSQASPDTYKAMEHDIKEVEEKFGGIIIPTSSPDPKEDRLLSEITQTFLSIKDQLAELNKMVKELSGSTEFETERSAQFD